MDTLSRYVDLLAERMGGRAVLFNDEFFAPASNLVRPGRGVFIDDKYTERGKWMDGWETRRRRDQGHDWCLLELGLAGKIRSMRVDTHHFKGNHPEACSIEGCFIEDSVNCDADLEGVPFTEIVPRSPLDPDTEHDFPVDCDQVFTHVRLNIFPDGGVARLRAFGEVIAANPRDEEVDLASIELGATACDSSDAFFGTPIHLLLPGRGINMGDGWETRRRRGPGHDWAVIALGRCGRVHRLLVDTCHFKGNFPESCSIEGCHTTDEPVPESAWQTILSRTPLEADHEHEFTELVQRGPFTHVRLNIFPDGGVSRLRVFGSVEPGKDGS